MLESGPLSEPEFAKFGKQVVLLLHNTSHVEGEPHGDLLREKGFNAFPTLCFMDADGNVLVKQGDRSIAGFQSTLQRLEQRQQVATKAAKGDAAAEKELFLIDLELGSLKPEQIAAAAKKLTLSKEEQQRVDQALTDGEFAALTAKMQRRQLGREEAAAKVAEMAQAGRRPSPAQAPNFWFLTLTHAANVKDAKLAEQAFAEAEKALEGNRQKDRILPQLQKLLEQSKQK